MILSREFMILCRLRLYFLSTREESVSISIIYELPTHLSPEPTVNLMELFRCSGYLMIQLSYVDQGGGKRNGPFAIYLEPWHPDILDFLELKKNHGNELERARDLFYALSGYRICLWSVFVKMEFGL